MPHTAKKTGPELDVEIDGRRDSFYAGDTIIGRVVRRAHAVAPSSWVQISLVGCAQNNHLDHGSHCRFLGTDETGIRLYDGPVHIPPDGDPLSWPFALTIPTKMSLRTVRLVNEQRYSNPSLKITDTEAPALLSSFRCEPYDIFVEYYLEAIFRMKHDSSVEVSTAIVPVTVHSSSPPLPASGFALKYSSESAHVATPRLLPGAQEAELTFRQRAQRLVGSSKVPRLGYFFEVRYPTVLQIANHTPISFSVRVVLDPSHSSQDVTDSKHPVPFTLVSLELWLHAETGPLHRPGEGRRTETMDLNFRLDLISWRTVFGDPLILPSRADEKPLDLGELLQLRVGAREATAVGKPSHAFGFGRELYPSFTTFNITHSHRLKWQVVVEVAGEEMTHSSEAWVTVKAPSRDAVGSAAPIGMREADVEAEGILPRYEEARGELERPPEYLG